MADLEVAWTACAKTCDEAQSTKKAKAVTKAECSSLQVEVSKISLEMEGRVCAVAEEVAKRAKEAHAMKVREV